MTELPDRLLRDALRAAAPARTSNVCFDTDALAAWADGTMRGDARAAFEIHAADCGRCQALMAAMARTEPARIETAWWRCAPFSWLMPLTAGAAAIVFVIAFALTERGAPELQTARNEPSAAPPLREEDKAAAAPPPAASPAPVAAPPSPTTSAPTEPASKALATAPAAASARIMASADTARSNRAETRVVETRIASPDPASQWRIVNGAVGHSDDGGATWQEQALGVTLPVRAGAAPAARVCWLAGARGLVLLTTDGVHWRRIAFPEPDDLVAIEATDASHATVTSASGRRFRTEDGGRTWSSR